MNKENETYENDVQLYDKTDDFDVNCDSTEDEEIYPEEMDYELPGNYNNEKTIAVIGILLIFVFCLIVFILCSLTR